MAEESRFAKIARVSVTGSGANTLTFNEFQTGVGLQVGPSRGKGMAMLVDQIDYWVQNLTSVIVGAGDLIRYGISTSDQIPEMGSFDDQRVLHAAERRVLLTTSGALEFIQPSSHQFFPALIWAEPTLFVGVDGASQGAAPELNCRIYYRLVELDQQLIFEVAQAFRVIS